MKKIVNLELSLTTACLNFKIISKKIDDQRFLTKIIDLLFFYNPNAILYNNAPQIPPAIGATTGTQP